MRRVSILLVGAVAALASSPGDAHARSCFPRGAFTVARSSSARIFAHRYSGPSGNQTTLFGCLFRRNRAVELADGTEALWSPVAALAGNYAGIAIDFEEGASSAFDLIEIIDLRKGDGVMNTLIGGGIGAHMGSLVIRRNRAAAWISCDGDSAYFQDPVTPCSRRIRSTQTVSVRPSSLGRGNGEEDSTVVDTGQSIDPFSLRLRGSTLTWTHGGVKRHAQLR